MNIFFLDIDPFKIAKQHCDKHVVKMILETAQLLCSAHHATGSTLEIPYKKTHVNHPCAVWAREDMHNYRWLCTLGIALCREYSFRYFKVHKSLRVIKWAIKNKPNINNLEFTLPPQCYDDDLKFDHNGELHNIHRVIKNYQIYYQRKLDNGMDMRYTNTTKPNWLH